MKSQDTLSKQKGEYVSFTRSPPRGESILWSLSPDKDSCFEFHNAVFSTIQEAYDSVSDIDDEMRETIMEMIITQRMEVDPLFCRVLSRFSGHGVSFYFCDPDHYWGCTIPKGIPVEQRPLHAIGENRLGKLYNKVGRAFYESSRLHSKK